jgi:DNA-binding NarL/FixJ family response regulator
MSVMAAGRRPVSVGMVHPLRAWLEALDVLLAPEPDVDLVVAHTDLPWVRNAVSRGEVDVVLLTVGAGRGVDEVRQMREAGPQVGVVVISDRDQPEFITDLVRAGARGIVPESCTLEELLHTIHGVNRGETWLPPAHVTKLVDTLLSSDTTGQAQQDRLAPLSAREREILECLALGMERQEIADKLFLSPNTVRTHINHVLRKLDVHSALAAVSIARQLPRGEAVPRRPEDDRVAG